MYMQHAECNTYYEFVKFENLAKNIMCAVVVEQTTQKRRGG